jgi:hypothetical protein
MAHRYGSVEGVIRGRYERYLDLLDLAETSLSAGDMPAVAALAQVAARSVFPDHAGLFSSPRLERLLLAVGRDMAAPQTSRWDFRRGGGRDILHVITYARPVGGDCRFVWRWMLADRESTHSVAITTQAHYKGVFDIPTFLRDSAEASGGRVHEIRASASLPIQQARELRALCRGRDLIVLHLWPYDTVPSIALSEGFGDGRVVFVNLSDHTYWLGGGVSHQVANLRTQCEEFLVSRRGLATRRATTLPIPLEYRPRESDRAGAKRALGFPPEAVLLLTIASPFKFSMPGQPSFLELVVPILEKFRHVYLLAIGPENEGSWESANLRTNGRVKALGARWNNDAIFAAADVYLDSIPFSSITSLLEAGIRGLPVLGRAPSLRECSLLGPGAPGIEGVMELAKDDEEFGHCLTRLVSERSYREQRGEQLRQQILSFHTGHGWISSLRRLYDDVSDRTSQGCIVADHDAFAVTALDTSLAALYAHAHEPDHVARLIRNYIGALPYGSRRALSRRLRRLGFSVSPITSLPPPLNGLVREIGRPAKRVYGRIRSSMARTRR